MAIRYLYIRTKIANALLGCAIYKLRLTFYYGFSVIFNVFGFKIKYPNLNKSVIFAKKLRL